MNESEFHRAVDEVLARIERAAEATEGIDADLEAGILTLECPDGSRIIVNRQAPNREIWVAARSGGFHFGWKEGAWRDTRSGAEFFSSLAEIARLQAGEALRFG
jgi:CyaY protein